MQTSLVSPYRTKKKRSLRWRRASTQRYPGQMYDVESGLHHNGFRDYEPGRGGYIESDPIGLVGGINTYGYVGGNPLSWIDPDGLDGIRVDPEQLRRQGERDALTSMALGILTKYWRELGRKNIVGVDQFYHCLASCKATQATNDPKMVLELLASKEWFDGLKNEYYEYDGQNRSAAEMRKDMEKDMAVNRYGAACGMKEDCVKRCGKYLDRISVGARPYMSEYRTWGVKK